MTPDLGRLQKCVISWKALAPKEECAQAFCGPDKHFYILLSNTTKNEVAKGELLASSECVRQVK